MSTAESLDVQIHSGTLPSSFWYVARECGLVAWDIETTGLDWRECRIATCQLYAPGQPVVIVQVDDAVPLDLARLLQDESITKVFHHAMFDLRFLAHHWGVTPQNIVCTKIAAKLLRPEAPREQSLKPLLRQYLGIDLDKGQQASDWSAHVLSAAQLNYAASDVLYLLRLLGDLKNDLRSKELLGLAEACWAHIPTRVLLELDGYPDVYQY